MAMKNLNKVKISGEGIARGGVGVPPRIPLGLRTLGIRSSTPQNCFCTSIQRRFSTRSPDAQTPGLRTSKPMLKLNPNDILIFKCLEIRNDDDSENG